MHEIELQNTYSIQIKRDIILECFYRVTERSTFKVGDLIIKTHISFDKYDICDVLYLSFVVTIHTARLKDVVDDAKHVYSAVRGIRQF